MRGFSTGEDGSTRTLAAIGGIIGPVGVIGGIAMTFTEDAVVFSVNPESDGGGERWSSAERSATARSESGLGLF